jgi:hypothetical protein
MNALFRIIFGQLVFKSLKSCRDLWYAACGRIEGERRSTVSHIVGDYRRAGLSDHREVLGTVVKVGNQQLDGNTFGPETARNARKVCCETGFIVVTRYGRDDKVVIFARDRCAQNVVVLPFGDCRQWHGLCRRNMTELASARALTAADQKGRDAK